MMDGLTLDEQEILLGRPVESLLTDKDREAYEGQRCLVTGAAGSVGSELSRQIAACRPAGLTLVDQSEEGLFRLEQQLRQLHPNLSLDIALSDVTRMGSVKHAVRRAAPQIVFHAAAYKHVTMAERAACAAARVNVMGTAEVLTALRDSGARFVLVSSDKAAAPRSVMGATKRFAELLTLANADRGFTPMVVRFGNVLASSGSFVPMTRERIQAGLPILLTHPEATRYFMALTEAAALVMKSAACGSGGETFWLDMGQQVRMGDLAERLQMLAARRGWPQVPTEIIGLRPGEKLVEQLTTDADEESSSSVHPRVRVSRPPLPWLLRVESLLRILRRHVGQEDALGTLRTLKAAVTDFEPSAHAWASAQIRRAEVDDASDGDVEARTA
ncbi:MAG: polysaccharide biosynthesis protein [Acidobacteria bacterium]|nr:polysaccharide biosynthesis protein [Acidobacteriota bacterium]